VDSSVGRGISEGMPCINACPPKGILSLCPEQTWRRAKPTSKPADHVRVTKSILALLGVSKDPDPLPLLTHHETDHNPNDES
jgi:hypothetical protein